MTDDIPDKPKLDLSIVQVIAAVLVTVTTTIAGSFFGTSGTLISAVGMSAFSTVAGALYKHGLTVIPATVRNGRVFPAHRQWKIPTVSGAQWTAMGVLAAGILGTVVVMQTAVEAVAGKPVSAIVRNEPGHGTTLGGGHVGDASRSPSPVPTPSLSPSQSIAPATSTAPSAISSTTPSVPPSIIPSVPVSPPPTAILTQFPTPEPSERS